MPDARPLPELIEGSGLIIRRWVGADVEPMAQVVAESVEHLRPWMPWVEQEPLTLEARRELVSGWERDWLAGGDVVLGILRSGEIVGGTGMHRRIGHGGIEIGYWVHPARLRQGIATTAAGLVTEAAFSQTRIDRVEIHHDKANVASAGVPAKLGFTLIEEYLRPITAPAETGTGCLWRTERDEWERRPAGR
jgi:RimJ/RimL family protein N-acetyltransferase